MITYIFGASDILDYSYLKKLDFTGCFIICADGGVKHARRLNLVPDVIIGDFDSSKILEYKNKIVYPKEKDDTDLALAINYASENGFCKCVGIGCLGNRLDHTFANIFLIKYAADKNVDLELIDDKTRVFLVLDKKKIEKEDFKYVSIFSVSPKCEGVTLKGFKYTLNNYTLSCDYPLGISNVLLENTGEISIKSGALVVMGVKE
ncbi:MAG: thiamine diphosphokinase [Ruminococcaceae bacterium]|nr:thiamine diphosphokinase [Oscillospiraceae bacterium]